ncbi:MAG TPA: BrnT family toxin [Alphaproteobacteria bacterium]|jgi:uncharacterized DUF497 family protein|nr:BrnT family toxin [Alphaproteobacteria bacterium]
MRKFKNTTEFQWDRGNHNKNWLRHEVSNEECEEVFFDRSRFIFKDNIHSDKEERFRILGKTKKNRFLFIVFTKRGKKIRIISARDVNKKEVQIYEKKINFT